MFEGFNKKTPEQLVDQTKSVSEILDREIVPQSLVEEINDMSLTEIKEKFPTRYDIYLKILRASKGSVEISEDGKKEMCDWLATLNNLDTYIGNHKIGVEKTLRERQFSVFEDLRSFLEKGGKGGYVKLPTGAGKTVIFSEFIEALKLKTLIVVPKKFLVKQTEEKLEEFATDLDVGKIYSLANTVGKDVTIITYQSLIKRIQDGSLDPREYPCLILDEVHESLSQKRMEAVRKFSNSIKIGFSATPTEHIRQLLETEIHSLGVKEASEEGVICPFSVILVETSVDMSGIKIKSNGEFNEVDLEHAVNIESRNNAAVDIYKNMFFGRSAIAYCAGVRHAEKIAEDFRNNDISAAVISGKTKKAELEILLQQFKRGEISVLCNSDILIAGFDEKKASVCFNLRPTMSPIVAEQRGGRVLRLNPEDEDKHAVIVDFIDHSTDKIEPIMFAEIADASVTYPNKVLGDNIGVDNSERQTINIPDIKIEGLKIITDHHEVMRIVKSRVEKRVEHAPEGWVTMPTLVNLSGGTSYYSINKIINPYRKTNPDWFKIYLANSGQTIEHISPELLEIITKDLENLASRVFAPEGWRTMNGFMLFLKRKAPEAVINIVDRYRKTNPDWFKQYKNLKGKIDEHFSPELQTIVIKELEERVTAPEGWKTAGGLVDLINRDDKFIRKKAQTYRELHPDWFKMYVDKSGKNAEHYSPELINELIKRFKRV